MDEYIYIYHIFTVGENMTCPFKRPYSKVKNEQTPAFTLKLLRHDRERDSLVLILHIIDTALSI